MYINYEITKQGHITPCPFEKGCFVADFDCITCPFYLGDYSIPTTDGPLDEKSFKGIIKCNRKKKI